MVPTFSADLGPVGRASCGDLPLAGDDGGEPKSDPSSSSWMGGASSPLAGMRWREKI